MKSTIDDLLGLLPSWLPRQRWYAGESEPESVRVTASQPFLEGEPAMTWVLVEADGIIYQLLIGLRPVHHDLEFLHGSEAAVVGEEDGRLAYDATVDSHLALALLSVVAPGEEAERVRSAGVEQSNTSLIYDDRLILKLFRRLGEGPSLDVEVTSALAEAGFEHVSPPVAVWRRDGRDLAVVQPYLTGASEGWALALTSLRDLYDRLCDPAEAGGDFAGEANRLGLVTAEMHCALAEAFGRQPPDPKAWAASMRRQLERVRHLDLDRKRAAATFDRVEGLEDAGPAIRVHGDYHLAQVLRSDTGWFVLDFEGEPARPAEERRQPSSALKDVAGMLRSLDYAARVALSERDEFEQDEKAESLADAWVERNRNAFLDGYRPVAAQAGLLPALNSDISTLLAAFELEKAVYELGYEQAHRPTWVGIPLEAIRRITEV